MDLTVPHWGGDLSRRAARPRCSPTRSRVRHRADALTSCTASCLPRLHAKRPRKPASSCICAPTGPVWDGVWTGLPRGKLKRGGSRVSG